MHMHACAQPRENRRFKLMSQLGACVVGTRSETIERSSHDRRTSTGDAFPLRMLLQIFQEMHICFDLQGLCVQVGGQRDMANGPFWQRRAPSRDVSNGAIVTTRAMHACLYMMTMKACDSCLEILSCRRAGQHVRPASSCDKS